MLLNNAFAQWVDTEMTRMRFDDSRLQTETGLPREAIKEIRKGLRLPSIEEIGLFCRGIPRLKRQGGLLTATRQAYKEEKAKQKANKESKLSAIVNVPQEKKTETPMVEGTLGENDKVSPLRIQSQTEGQYSRIEEIDPSLAALLLTGNVRNRNISENHVATLVRVILDDKWMVTHQGIAMDKDGRLLDGQHRLTAIVKSGKTVRMMVTYNADPKSFQVVDTSLMPRSILNVMDMASRSGESLTKHSRPSSSSIAAVKILFMITTGAKRSKWTVSEVAEALDKYPGTIEVSKFQVARRSGIAAGFGYCYDVYPNDVKSFLEKISSMVEMTALHTAFLKAVQRVPNGDAGNVELALIAMNAIRLARKGETAVRKLYLKDPNANPFDHESFKSIRHVRERAGLAT